MNKRKLISKIIYLDYHSTTPVDPEVMKVMLPYFTQDFGNPGSSAHPYGWRAKEAVENGRKQVAELINVSPREIIFTSGATESNNLAIQGVVNYYKEKGNHIITSAIEHKSVLDLCRELEKQGEKVTYIPVSKSGLVEPDDIKKAITPKTILISIMLANNEIGTIQPVSLIGEIALKHGILFHTDAAQGAGKIQFDANKTNIDLASISSHKMYGPKGVGGLYVGRKARLNPICFGGGQERHLRPGTLNVPGITGFGKACEISKNLLPTESDRIKKLRDKLKDGILTRLDYVYLNGSEEHRLSGNLNLSFDFVEGESLIMGLQGIAVSSASACLSGERNPSYVLKNIGVSDTLAHASIRFCVGRFTTEEEIDYTIEEVVRKVAYFRNIYKSVHL